MDRSPTLFAPASGFGRAAVAVVRISGPASDRALTELSGPLPAPRRLVLRTLRDPLTAEVLDQALVVWMPGPGTFTGEDMAELHLHGGPAVRAAVLRALASIPECVPAAPGEFTRRAFLNGRMGLTEAEGIADLIDAETEAQRRQALRQLDGALGRQVADWRDRLIDLLAGVEAALDFSDEGDVDDDALDAALFAKAQVLRDAISATLDDGKRGERLRDGYTVVLAGPPNAGKSTLLNALSRRDAAIVSAIPGTTRDVIEVRCDLGGLPVLLIDTAGLREAGDAIEAEGIRRTRARIAQADLVLLLDEDGTEGDPAGLFSESTQTAFTTGGSPLLEGARRSHKASRVFGRFLTPCHPGAAQRNPGSRTIGFSRLYTVGRSRFRVRLRRPGMTMWSLRDRPAWKEREPVATDATSPVHATIPLPMDPETGRISRSTGHPDSRAVVLRVRTKSDRSRTPIPSDTLAISAMTGKGLDTLLDTIERHAANAISGEAALITRERHRDGLTRCRGHLDRLLQGATLPELAAEDLRLAVRALGEVGGHVGVEEMLDRLFSSFCIGK